MPARTPTRGHPEGLEITGYRFHRDDGTRAFSTFYELVKHGSL